MHGGFEDIKEIAAVLKSTGIVGLDYQLGGGFPAGHTILLYGNPYSGIERMSRQFWEAENEGGSSYYMIDVMAEEGMIKTSPSEVSGLLRGDTNDRAVVDSLSFVLNERGLEGALGLMDDASSICERGGNVLFLMYEGLHSKLEEIRIMRKAGIAVSLSEFLHGNEVERRLAIHKLPGAEVPPRLYPYNILANGIELSTTARVV